MLRSLLFRQILNFHLPIFVNIVQQIMTYIIPFFVSFDRIFFTFLLHLLVLSLLKYQLLKILIKFHWLPWLEARSRIFWPCININHMHDLRWESLKNIVRSKCPTHIPQSHIERITETTSMKIFQWFGMKFNIILILITFLSQLWMGGPTRDKCPFVI